MKYRYFVFRLSKLKIFCTLGIITIIICLGFYCNNSFKSDLIFRIDDVITANNLVEGANEGSLKEDEPKINGFNILGKIQIPSINLDTYILEKTDENSLKESVTKFYGGDINTQGNFCIAGHNFKNDKIFGDLYKVKVGDKIVIQDNYGRSLDYIVYDLYKTSPKDLECLKQDEEGSIQITLITCTTAALKRLIVKAKVIYD